MTAGIYSRLVEAHRLAAVRSNRNAETIAAHSTPEIATEVQDVLPRVHAAKLRLLARHAACERWIAGGIMKYQVDAIGDMRDAKEGVLSFRGIIRPQDGSGREMTFTVRMDLRRLTEAAVKRAFECPPASQPWPAAP